MIKIISSIIFFGFSLSFFSQKENPNKYQYIIVSSNFDFLKKADQFQTSSLTKFLLKKKGFEVFLDNEDYPKEIVANRCAALFANVLDDSGTFNTKNRIELKDCYGKVVYLSGFGESRNKDYKKAYHQAIRNAFNSMGDLKYSNDPSNKVVDKIVAQKKVSIVEQLSDTIESKIKNPEKLNKPISSFNNNVKTLYGQSIENGFQLIDTKPKVVFELLNTSVQNVFIINAKKGIFFKLGDKWIAEYYEGTELKREVFHVKF